MKNRGALYVGLMLLLLGFFFLFVNVGSALFPRFELIRLGRLWPLLIVWAGLGFFLPIFVWWHNRQRNYGLAMPGTVLIVIGLALLYSSLSGNWSAWAYLWTLVPFSVALGLLALYLLGPRVPALLVAAFIVGGVSLAIFAVIVSALGSVFGGVLGAILLVILGGILLVRALVPPSGRGA